MITQKCLNEIKKFAHSQSIIFSKPSLFHLDLSYEKGTSLAHVLHANIPIVQMGTLLMDCMLGDAFQQGKIQEHIKMGVKKSQEILKKYPEITKKEKENILACISQHHGARVFKTLESEICCNADCYRFISVRGVIGGLGYTNGENIDDIVRLYRAKSEEKWNALSLKICKEELASEYQVVHAFLEKNT